MNKRLRLNNNCIFQEGNDSKHDMLRTENAKLHCDFKVTKQVPFFRINKI